MPAIHYFIYCMPPLGGLQKNLYGKAQSRLQNFYHLYTSKSLILWPITVLNFCKKTPPIWNKLGGFLGLIFWNTPNFANWADWVLNGNPQIDIPIMTKKHLKPLIIPVNHQPVRNPLGIMPIYYDTTKDGPKKTNNRYHLLFSNSKAKKQKQHNKQTNKKTRKK